MELFGKIPTSGNIGQKWGTRYSSVWCGHFARIGLVFAAGDADGSVRATFLRG